MWKSTIKSNQIVSETMTMMILPTKPQHSEEEVISWNSEKVDRLNMGTYKVLHSAFSPKG